MVHSFIPNTRLQILLAVAAVACISVLIFFLASRPMFGKNKPACYADIIIRDYGTITVALDAKAAPISVATFVSLAESGFYDGLTFFRIMEGFMMEGGDPNKDGTGTNGTNIKGEFTANGVNNPLSHTRGAISMSRFDEFDSASCQFFIVQQDSTYLDGEYAAFGYVTKGIEVLDAICAAAKPVDDNGKIPLEQQPVIETITIRK